MDKLLHIICLDVPYPVDYGGVFDLFYKLPALQQLGVKIFLHCFTKDRKDQPELNKYCEAVYYYQRNLDKSNLMSGLPYIVASRIDETLHRRLLQDDYPILMEGVHCTFITTDERFKNRKLFVRLYNVEHEYYRHLYKFSHNIRHELYYFIEAKKLYNYERKLVKNVAAFFTVAHQDAEYYRKEFNCNNIEYLPLFIPEWQVQSQEGMGAYCLYHGKLSVEENEYAVEWLIKNVFCGINIPFVIAGKSPTKKILKLAAKNSNITIHADPSDEEMQDIIAKAHIHVLPSFNNTGIKIKLLNALFNGRHCAVNDAMIEGTHLDAMCHIVNDASEFKERIQLLYHQPFTTEEKEYRKQILMKEFNNNANALQLVKWIWETGSENLQIAHSNV
ncbi:MAG: glycosyltransferase [Bacteroidetes bacterium]|nr:glycosyltransferase [Bacteroidota bacterium]